MRYASAGLVGLALCATLGLAQTAAAQPAAPPTIHRVTVQPDAGVRTITGTGLGSDLLVTVDGQFVTTLPGATDTQLEVGGTRHAADDARHLSHHGGGPCATSGGRVRGGERNPERHRR